MCIEGDMHHTFNIERDVEVDMSIYVFFTGSTISLVALLTTLAIFLSFRELRCLPHKIHIGLFLTLIFYNVWWILTGIIKNFIETEHYEFVVNHLCISQVVLRYFHLTTFVWVFLDGLYLFLQVQPPLSLTTIRHLHFLLIGWGCPALIMLVWGGTRVAQTIATYSSPEDWLKMTRNERVDSLVMACPFMQELDTDFFAFDLPVFVLLVTSSFFLVIAVSKLRTRTALDDDRRHYKAANALGIVIPFLGITYLLTLVELSEVESSPAFRIFHAVRAALRSTEGAVITLPYCFLDSEVHEVVKLHRERRKMARNVGSECQSTGASLAPSSVYYAQDSTDSPELQIATPQQNLKLGNDEMK